MAADRERLNKERTGLRRMTRWEYENTVRDLFDMPGIALSSELPRTVPRTDSTRTAMRWTSRT